MAEGKKNLWDDDPVMLALHPLVHDYIGPLRSTKQTRADREHWKHAKSPFSKYSKVSECGWEFSEPAYSEIEALRESYRCLKCADAPCTASCPTGVDVKQFIYNISKQNYYNAARHIYSDNPLGLTCGVVCATSRQCRGACNLCGFRDGPIEIGHLQQFACDVFLKMGLREVRDPNYCPSKLGPSYNAKIALVGAGPASLSCATYLWRLGYSNITIMEKQIVPGGIIATTVPQHRLPFEIVAAECGRVRARGVKFVYGKELGKDITLDSLKKDGNAAVFVGIGLPEVFNIPCLEEEGVAGLYNYKEFLTRISHATKDLGHSAVLPKLQGHVVVLGGGDTAYDCASSALRCGADRVTLAFREDFLNLPCCQEELEEGLRENCELIANVVPTKLIKKDGKVAGVVLKFQDWTPKSGLFQVEGERTVVVNASTVIVAFGAKAAPAKLMAPAKVDARGRVVFDAETMATDVPGVFLGGDMAGSVSVVEAVNDGKVAAWNIHKLIQGEAVAKSVPRFPLLHTAVDDVDISVDVLGLHFVNPFGMSSASPTTSVPMLMRAFANGWGFSLTKTIMLDKDISTNVSPRIIRAPSYVLPGPQQAGFQNIELLTEKSPKYWCDGIREMKKRYPDRIVIASIMASCKEDWEVLAKQVQESGPDALELNLSCPHTGKKGFGMLAGQDPDMVKEITGWVVEAVRGMNAKVIVKLTPNITDIAAIGKAAVEGGADAVAAINTVSGLTSVQPNGLPWPNVGDENKTAYGGVSGNMIRPVALKAVSALRRALPDTPILGIGGIDSAESAMQMIHCGADVIQITSAIQNQENSIIDELVSGLRAHLYMKAHDGFRDWVGQNPPSDAKYATRDIRKESVSVPKLMTERDVTAKLVSVVPELDLNAQVVAKVDEENCVKCGKCYMSCNDTGYQAISFEPGTHRVTITDRCMGCGLCLSVCPTACISYVPKQIPHKPDRGIPNKDVKYLFD